MKMEEKDTITLTEHRAMVCLPNNAVSVEIRCRIYDEEEDKVISVSKFLKLEDIREAFRKADDGYTDDEDRFVLTDEGRAYLDEMESKKNG